MELIFLNVIATETVTEKQTELISALMTLHLKLHVSEAASQDNLILG